MTMMMMWMQLRAYNNMIGDFITSFGDATLVGRVVFVNGQKKKKINLFLCWNKCAIRGISFFLSPTTTLRPIATIRRLFCHTLGEFCEARGGIRIRFRLALNMRRFGSSFGGWCGELVSDECNLMHWQYFIRHAAFRGKEAAYESSLLN